MKALQSVNENRAALDKRGCFYADGASPEIDSGEGILLSRKLS
jgi:hypothetical protein